MVANFFKNKSYNCKKRRNMRKRKNIKKRKNYGTIWMINLCLILVGTAIFVWYINVPDASPEETLKEYMSYISNQKYEQMYEMIDVGASGNICQEDFVKRNSAIYEGIGVDNIKIHITSYDKEQKEICYETSMDTVAGNVTFENNVSFIQEKGTYKLVWSDSLIFPELDSTDKVKVSVTNAERGQILDRNGRVLAGKGVASSVGVVPGKLENRDDAISQLADLLEMKVEDIERKLSAKWVKEDSFVPLKTIPKVDELKLLSLKPDKETLAEKERHEKLLEIPGVKISDIGIREYPLGEAAAHLVGYVQNVTAEDLEEHDGEGYTSNSVIGKSGMEGLFEKELKGQNGCSITIVYSNGNKKKIIVSTIVENGKDIKLTIDSNLQKELYEQFKDDKSCSVAINQYTGEVLALVSTPSYDNNDFIRGMSSEKWNALNEDENKPMYNRFRQVWCPGSTFKPIIAAIGLTTGAIDPNEDYGNEGLSWQKDSSWGSYHVTTLHAYEPVILKNALIYSDNIYFAKAALKIGERDMESSLTKLGFNEELPFDIKVAKSQFSNTDKIEKEIQLADSGYGQGQILVNPLHMACIYSAFCNEGNMIKPYLTYKEDAIPNVWVTAAFTKDAAQMVLEDTKEVINNPHGTGYAACRTDITLAGKTGTAEIKASKEDTTGTELGWFSVFTTDENMDRPIMIISMVEDVKGRGGSGYVVKKDSQVLEKWLSDN
jgi:cell division protein FtsI/penicillin-binding protein 2